jgi:von Willebrand factor type A domain
MGRDGAYWCVSSSRLRAALVCCALIAAMTTIALPAPARAATAAQTDVMFVFDTSGSMEPVLNEAKAEIQAVMTQLDGSLPNVEFGLAEARDYGGSAYDADSDDEPWKLDVPVTSNLPNVTESISELEASGGGDGPEAYGRALWETDTNPNVGWREGARHLIVLIADQVPHDPNVDEGIPEEFWAAPSPWETGEELPGTWGIPGTQLKEGEKLAFHSVLHQLASDGKPLEMVDYHDTEGDFIHYWENWAALAGGQAIEADESGGELADKLVPLIETAPEDTACSTSATPTESSPLPPGLLPTALTPRFLQPGSPIVLLPASGKEFCTGQDPVLGASIVTSFEEATPTKLAFRTPAAATSGLSLTNLTSVPGPQQVYAVDNFRYPWGFSIINSAGTGAGETYDAAIPITAQDLDSVFANLGPPKSPEYQKAEADAKATLGGGLCYGFSLMSWALYGDSHGQNDSLGFTTSSGLNLIPGAVPYFQKEASSGPHGLTHVLMRGAVSQYSNEVQQTKHPITSAAGLLTQLNSAFQRHQPALLSLFWDGGREGHTVLGFDYQSPDPATKEGVAVDVVDPNVPWNPSRPPSDYQMLQIHVRANGSWYFSGSFSGVPNDFTNNIGGDPGSLYVQTEPREPGGLSFTPTPGSGAGVSIEPSGASQVTAISYSSARGNGLPADVQPQTIAYDAASTGVVVPSSHHTITATIASPTNSATRTSLEGPGFLDQASLPAGHETVTVESHGGGLGVPVATRDTTLEVTSVVHGVQHTATATFTGQVRKPTLSVNGAGVVSLTAAGGAGHVSLDLSIDTAAGGQAQVHARLVLRGRTHVRRHTPKIKHHKRPKHRRRHRR